MKPDDLKRHTENEDVRHRCFALRRAMKEYMQVFTENARSRGGPPDEAQIDKNSRESELADAVLNQAAQLQKALDQGGMAGMEDDLGDRVRHLRNVREHWEQHRASFSNPGLQKDRSGQWYAPDKTPWSASWSNSEGFVIGGIIKLNELDHVLDRVEPSLPRSPWLWDSPASDLSP